MISIRLHYRVLIGAIAVIASVLSSERNGLTQESRVLSADLAINFVCANKPRSELETGMEEFVNGEGFNVLNQGRLQRDHGIYLLNTQIVGLDGKRDILEFVGLPVGFAKKDTVYNAGLRSPPPTRRSPQLEEAVLTFVSKGLGCDVRQVTRGENGPDAIQFYDREFARIESVFRDADILKKRQPQ
jgi:hypothetical protein